MSRLASLAPPIRRLCTSAFQSLSGNQIATGGLTVLAAGTGLAAARSIAQLGWEAVLRRMVVRAEIDSKDDSYRWVLQWLAAHPHFSEGTRFTVSTTLRRFGASSLEYTEEEIVGEQPVILIPSGTTLLRHEGHWLLVSRERHEDRGNSASTRERETLTLQMLGGTKATLLALLEEARRAFAEQERQRTPIYFVDESGGWSRVASRVARPLESVVLGDAQLAGALLADCRRFLSSEAWYAQRGARRA